MTTKKIIGNLKALELMHGLMLLMNNELAYDEWVYTFPDEPSKEDYIEIAEDEASYQEVEKEFFRLLKVYGNDGLYIAK